MARTGRKKYRVKGRFYLFLLIAAILFAFLINYVVGLFAPPTVEWGRLDSDIKVTAMIARDEHIVYTAPYADISCSVAEGEAVKTGDEIAILYTSGYSDKDIENLSELQQDIKTQQDVILQKSVVDKDMDAINEGIVETLHQVSQMVMSGDTRSLLLYQRQLSNLMVERKEYTYEVVSEDSYLEQLYQSEIELLDKISQYQTVLDSPQDGIVSFFFDGAETMLDATHMENLIATDVLSMKDAIMEGDVKDSTVTGSVVTNKYPLFRVINPNRWFALIVLPMSDNTLVEGQVVDVTFEAYEDELLTATVSSVRTEKREVLVMLEFDMPIKSMVSLRLVDGYIGKGAEGFKVKKEAVHNLYGDDGITVLVDGEELFIPVDVLDSDETHSIIIDAVYDDAQTTQTQLLETGFKVVMP